MTTAKKPAVKKPAVKKFVIVRGTNGTYVGRLESRTGQEVTLSEARWLYSWSGRFGLATLAAVGPDAAQMSGPAPLVEVLDAYVVLTCSAQAEAAFAAVTSR